MPCYHPISAYRCSDGSVVFAQLGRYDIVGDIQLPCGQCIGCRIDRSREWAVRCLHEAKSHDENAFLTLTYNDENLPSDGSLHYEHFQLFMKRLRYHVGPVRFFMAGEYGDENQRPHYHALIFGYGFPDKKEWSKSPSGCMLYRSALLEKLWEYGLSSIGEVTRESAGYVARYCLKKVTGDLAEAHYKGRTPEFAHMSVKPGIGAEWFKKFKSDMLPCDYVVADGVKVPVPRYYEKLYAKGEDDLDEIKMRREIYGRSHADNNTTERLLVREEVAKAKLSQLKRGKV